MAISNFTDFRIAGISACVPKNKLENDFFSKRFGAQEVEKFEKLTGIRERRVSDRLTTSDLCHRAAEKLLSSIGWNPSEVGCVLLVTQTPDHVMPASSHILHRRLGLSPAAAALDVNLGCSGFPYGLNFLLAYMRAAKIDKAIMCCGEVVTKLMNPNDRATSMLFGDAGTVVAIESASNEHCMVNLGADGNGYEEIIVKNSPSNWQQNGGDFFVTMNGAEVFNFATSRVFSEISKHLESNKLKIDDFDCIVFHQANGFILKQLERKLSIPKEKMIVNIDRFGNTSSASIPLAIVTELQKSNKRLNQNRILAVGFGVGLSWGIADFKLHPNIELCFVEV